MALGDLFRCTYRYNCSEQPITITLGYEHIASDGADEYNLTGLISGKVAAEMSSLREYLSQQCSFEGARTIKLTGAPQPPGTAATTDLRGIEQTAAVPHSKALMVVHRQITRGVRSNGKSYISGLPEVNVNGNVCTDNASIVGIKDIFDDLLQFTEGVTNETATFRMVVLSRPDGPQGPFVGLPVIENRLNTTMYNQRRRQTREFGYSGDDDLQ